MNNNDLFQASRRRFLAQLGGLTVAGMLGNDIKPIWAYADSLYNGTCNQCHGAPEISHFDANGWIGTLNGMIGFTSLDKREERTLLKYLQMNAYDTAGKAPGDKKEEK